jgi:phage terminase large subunit-like protein
VSAWVAGEDVKAVRGSIQPLLFGVPKTSESEGVLGTGLIPGDDIIGDPTANRGAPEAIDSATIKHISGGKSRVEMKTYEQGRKSFQASKIDIGWADEEPPEDIYSEFLTRLMSTVPGEANGIMMCTFTPLKGMSTVVMNYLGDDWRRPDANDAPAI